MGTTSAWNPLLVALMASAALGLLVYAGVSCSFLDVVAHNGDLLVVLPTSHQAAQSTATIGLLCDGDFYDLRNDKMWNLSRMFFFVSGLVGAISSLTAWVISTCVLPTSALWLTVSVLAAITAVLQVPVFLLFQSKPCSEYHADQTCHLGPASYVMIGSIGGWISVVLLTQILDPPVWVRELDHWRVHKINATQSEDEEGLLQERRVSSSEPAPAAAAATFSEEEATSSTVLSLCRNWRRRHQDGHPLDDMTPTLMIADEEEGRGIGSSESSVYLDRSMDGLVVPAGSPRLQEGATLGGGDVEGQNLDASTLDQYGFPAEPEAAHHDSVATPRIASTTTPPRDRSMDATIRGTVGPASEASSRTRDISRSIQSRDALSLKIVHPAETAAPIRTQEDLTAVNSTDTINSREQAPITHALANIMPVVSAISGDTDGVGLDPAGRYVRAYQVIPVEAYHHQTTRAELDDSRSITLGSLASKTPLQVTGDESILDDSREQTGARSMQEQLANLTQLSRSTDTTRGRSTALSGVRGLAGKLRSASMKTRLRNNYSLMDDDNMEASFPLSPPVEIITLNGGDEELCNLSPAMLRSESELNLLNHWNRIHSLPRGITPVVLDSGPKFSFSDDETGDDRTPDPIVYHDGDVLMTYGSLAASSPRSEMAKARLQAASPDPLSVVTSPNLNTPSWAADDRRDTGGEYNSHQADDDFDPYASTHPFKRTRSAPNLAAFAGTSKAGPKLSEDIIMSGMHQYHKIETWRYDSFPNGFEQEPQPGGGRRGRHGKPDRMKPVPKRNASPIFRRDRDARGATFHIPLVSDDSGDDDEVDDGNESSLETDHTSRSRVARQARIRRMQRRDPKQGSRSRTLEPPTNRRHIQSDPYSSSSLLDTLDLQLTYVQRPEGQEYGPEERSL